LVNEELKMKNEEFVALGFTSIMLLLLSFLGIRNAKVFFRYKMLDIR